MRTPLGRVRYLGSARGGTNDFWLVRITGAAVFLLSVVFVAVLISAVGRSHAGVLALIGSPLIAAVLALFVALSAIHMRIGMQEIIEDYVHGERMKILATVANTFFSVAVAAVGVVAVLKIAAGASGNG